MLNPVPPSTGGKRILLERYKQYKGIAGRNFSRNGKCLQHRRSICGLLTQLKSVAPRTLRLNVRDHALYQGHVPLCPGRSVRTLESQETICKKLVGSRCRVMPRTVSRSICINARATRRALDIKRVEEDLTRKSVRYDVHKQWLSHGAYRSCWVLYDP
jgi:hypothetical protein